MGRIGHQLVVLDEVDPRLAKLTDQGSGLLGRQADAWLDDGSDDRAPLDSSELVGFPPRQTVGPCIALKTQQAIPDPRACSPSDPKARRDSRKPLPSVSAGCNPTFSNGNSMVISARW